MLIHNAWMNGSTEWMKAEPALVFQTVINWNTVKVNAKNKMESKWDEMRICLTRNESGTTVSLSEKNSGASKQPIMNLNLMKLNKI